MVLLLTSNVGNDAMHRVIGGVYELYILLVVVGGVQELNMVFLSHLHGSNGNVCPVWLLNKILAVHLPVDRDLSNGLLITLFRPYPLRTRVNYYEPIQERLARVTVVVNKEVESLGKKELITLKIGSDRSPVIMTINEMLLDNTTMYQARLLIDGAVRRQYSPSSSQCEVSLGTPGTAV